MTQGPRIGTVLSLPGAALAELAGAALDLAWIDLEHGALGPADVPPLAIALRAAGCEAHVRLAGPAPAGLPALLDAGVDGLVAPGVETPGEAAELVAALPYPPAGVRGSGPRRAGGRGRVARYGAAPEARVALTVQIESPAGVAAARAIAATDGVDAVDARALAALAPRGTAVVICSADVRLYAQAIDRVAAELRDALGAHGRAAA